MRHFQAWKWLALSLLVAGALAALATRFLLAELDGLAGCPRDAVLRVIGRAW